MPFASPLFRKGSGTDLREYGSSGALSAFRGVADRNPHLRFLAILTMLAGDEIAFFDGTLFGVASLALQK